MLKTSEDDARVVYEEAKRKGELPPGYADARHMRCERSWKNRSRRKEVKGLRKDHGAEVLVSRGDASFGPDGANWNCN